MKKSIIKKIFLTIFIGIISLGFFYGCAGTVKKTGAYGIKIRGGEERLVAKRYSRSGDNFFTLKWCGNDGLFFRSEIFQVGIIDIKTGKRRPLELTLSDDFLNCTPDGKKLFYMDYASKRDGDKTKKTDIEIVPGVFLWRGGNVRDMYLYDIEIHRKTLIANVHGAVSNDVLSPDGKKILLGNRHRLTLKKGGPDEWQAFWFAREKEQKRAIWFPDSSGVLSSGTMYADTLCVEFFGKDGWDRCFKQEDSMLELKMDREGGIYYQEGHPSDEHLFLKQCVIKDKNVVCKRMLEKYDVFRNFDFLPGGDIIFEDYNNDLCVHRSTPKGKVDECVVGVKYGDRIYDSVSVIGVSPDGRWLALDRGNKTMIKGRKMPYWESDLFVIELKDN